MGGRGAVIKKETYQEYVKRLLNSKEYSKENNPGYYSMKYENDYIKEEKARTSAQLTNKESIIDYVKTLTNIDLEKAEGRIDKKRSYFNIDSRKLSQIEFRQVQEVLNKYGHNIKLESNGAYDYAISFEKKKKNKNQ